MFGRTFTLVIDHKPLAVLLREDRLTPVMAAARIQGWVLTLGAYSYRIEYKPGFRNDNADAMSRLPLRETGIVIGTSRVCAGLAAG